MAATSGTFISPYRLNRFAGEFSKSDTSTFPASGNAISNVDRVLFWRLLTAPDSFPSESTPEQKLLILKSHAHAIFDDALLPLGKRIKSSTPLNVSCSYYNGLETFNFHAKDTIVITTDHSDLVTRIPRLFERMLSFKSTELHLVSKQKLIFTNIPSEDLISLKHYPISAPTDNTSLASKGVQIFLKYLTAQSPSNLSLKGIEISCEKPWFVQFPADQPNSVVIETPDSPLVLKLIQYTDSQPASSKGELPSRVKQSFNTNIEEVLKKLFLSVTFAKTLIVLGPDKVGIFFNPTRKKMVLGRNLDVSENVTLISEKSLSHELQTRIIGIITSYKPTLTYSEICRPTINEIPSLQFLGFEQ